MSIINEQTKVFITGGAGFLGSAIIARLLKGNCAVIATKRTHTNLFRCEDFGDRVKWVDTSNQYFCEQVIEFNPDIIIHAAWSGVTSKARVDWATQLSNFEFLSNILSISEKSDVKKMILLGSQAEYGVINELVDESYPVQANDAYSACKLGSQKIVETFCKQHGIDWYWLRVFSVFGPAEADNWFIPWLINAQLGNTDIDLTLCQQQYDYLFIDDFANMISNILSAKKSLSGVYNICSGRTVPLKAMVEQIHNYINGKGKLNFGALPYRANQSMKIAGNNSKYNSNFGEIQLTELSYAIAKTISYYSERFISNKKEV